MSPDELIEGYAPRFSSEDRAQLIKECTSFSSISQLSTKHHLALFEHAIECGVKEVRRKKGFEFAFFHDVRTLADLRQWHKLAERIRA